MQRCILIGAGDCSVQKIETKPEDLVIAVDGGYDTCRKYDIVPDLIVGDFDSVQESDMPQIAEIAKIAPDHVVVLPTEKDDTDMALAVAKAYEKGYRNILLYGGCGGARRVRRCGCGAALCAPNTKQGCRRQPCLLSMLDSLKPMQFGFFRVLRALFWGESALSGVWGSAPHIYPSCRGAVPHKTIPLQGAFAVIFPVCTNRRAFSS